MGHPDYMNQYTRLWKARRRRELLRRAVRIAIAAALVAAYLTLWGPV